MIAVAATLMAVPAILLLYAYLGYPLLLLSARPRRRALPAGDPAEWPSVTVVVPAYNAEREVARTLDHLIAADYPKDRLHVLVVSDASTDSTDDIVAGFAARSPVTGPVVELLRQARRSGKTAAENAAAARLRGEIVVNTDATIIVPRTSIKQLVRPFQDAKVGIVSGRDVSVESTTSDASRAEARYSGYEMWVRALESRFGLIAGATGSLYAIRRQLYDSALPLTLTRDFASALQAYERGWTAAAVDDATCLVMRTQTLSAELRRKARTMAHGLETLWHYRRLANPARHGLLALMLLSHKLARWLAFPALPLGVAGLLLLSAAWRPALVGLVPALIVIAVGIAALRTPGERRLPAPIAVCGYAVAAIAAALAAWGRFLRRDHVLVWAPTRRAGPP